MWLSQSEVSLPRALDWGRTHRFRRRSLRTPLPRCNAERREATWHTAACGVPLSITRVFDLAETIRPSGSRHTVSTESFFMAADDTAKPFTTTSTRDEFPQKQRTSQKPQHLQTSPAGFTKVEQTALLRLHWKPAHQARPLWPESRTTSTVQGTPCQTPPPFMPGPLPDPISRSNRSSSNLARSVLMKSRSGSRIAASATVT